MQDHGFLRQALVYLAAGVLVVPLVAGMGFAMSSTAIGLATLQEKNLLPTPGGQASFSVLLFQDLAVIPRMLLLGLLSTDNTRNNFDWTATAKAVGVIVGLIVAGRFLLRPVLRYIANTRQREIFVGFALLLVIGIAALMELVGMSVDMGLFARSPGIVFLIAMAAVTTKIVILYPVAKTFGFCGRAGATLFALALSQVGEFAFVLFGAAAGSVPRAAWWRASAATTRRSLPSRRRTAMTSRS